MAPLFRNLSGNSRNGRIRRRNSIAQKRRTKLWGEMLEPRLMMAVDTPDIIVGRTLSAYSIADVQNNQLKITYSVYNQQAEDVSGVLLTTTLQAGVSLVDATQLPDQNGQELAWSFGTLPAYGRASVEVTVSIANGSVLTLDDGAEAFSTLNARASSDTTPAAVLKTTPLPAALLASTVDANTTDPFIQEQAAKLDYNPQNIIDFLQDEIGYESYTGSLRGARGTLWSNAGNSLDEASLGVALFRASGIPAQYAAGTISDPLAKQLILSMFPESYQTVGYIPAGIEVADPANDPQLLAETRQHFWIQFNVGAGLQDLDTTFPNSNIGQIFAATDNTFSEVANNLRHKVRISLDVEAYSQVSAAFGFGSGLDTNSMLDQTFAAVELVGKPLTLGNFVSRSAIPSPILVSQTTTFSPYIAVGDAASPLATNDTVIRGTAFQEIFTNFPLGNRIVTGLFLNVDLTDPDGVVQHLQRTIGDRIGFANRLGGGSTSIDPNGRSLLSESDVFNIDIVSERTDLRVPLTLAATARQSKSQFDALDDDSVAANGLLQRSLITETTRLIGRQFLEISDDIATRVSDLVGVLAYADRPRVVITSGLAREAEPGQVTPLSFAIDLRRDTLRVVALPGRPISAIGSFNYVRGIAETITEAQIVASTQPLDTVILNTQTIFDAAVAQGISRVFIAPTDLGSLSSILQASPEALARITTSLQGGKFVIAPNRPVQMGDITTTAWYEIDPVSGETIGITEDGGHAAITEYAAVLGVSGFFSAGLGLRAYISSLPDLDRAAWKAKIGDVQNSILGLSAAFGIVGGYQAVYAAAALPGALTFGGAITALAASPIVAIAGLFGAVVAVFAGGFATAGLVGAKDPSASGRLFDLSADSSERNHSLRTVQVNANESAQGVTGSLNAMQMEIRGEIRATWASNSFTSWIADAFEVSDATITDAQGRIIGSGTANLVSPADLRISGNISYDVSGTGNLSTYSASTASLGVSGEWRDYVASISGSAILELESNSIMLNGALLPFGKYLISTSAATVLGKGVTAANSYANSLSLELRDSSVNIGPGSAAALNVGGSAIDVSQGLGLLNYNGTIGVIPSGIVDSQIFAGTAAGVLRIGVGSPSASIDQNSSLSRSVQVHTSLTDTYDISVIAPQGWKVEFGSNDEIVIKSKAGVQSGTYLVRVVARSQSNPDLVAAADVTVTVTPTLPGLNFDVLADPIFTVPFNGAQLPTSFQATMQNLGPAADTYNITFLNPPAGFNILRSANSLTLPAGEMGITGVYLEPNGVLPAPGTSISFTVTATSQTNPLITQTETFTFQMPAVAAVTVESNPGALATIPGAPVTADVTIKNVGNVPYNMAVGATLPNGLALAGLTTPVLLAVGQTTTQSVTFTPAANTPLNSTLTPTINYGPAVAANFAAVVQVNTADSHVEAGQSVQVSAEILAGVLQAQQGSALFVVRNSLGAVVFTSTPVPVALTAITSAATVNLGAINTTGFANGEYMIEATIRDANQVPLPSAVGLGRLVVGLPLAASQDVSPGTLTEGLELTYVTGNATVDSSVTIAAQPLVSLIDTNGTAINVAMFGSLAYVAGTEEITIVDLTNPGSPQIVGTFGPTLPNPDSFNVAVVGNQLIVSSPNTTNSQLSNLQIYSLANPLSPQLVGSAAVPYRFRSDLLVQGNTALIPTSGITFTLPGTIINQFGDVVAVNFSNPASPAIADVLFNTTGSPDGGPTRQVGGTIVNSSLAYIGSSTYTGNNTQTGFGRVLVVNIANPSNLSVAGEVQIPGVRQVMDIAIEGNRALVVGSSGGIRNPFNGFADLGYDGTLTLTVLDITDPQNPVVIGTTAVTEAEFGSGTAPGLLQAVSLGNGRFAVSGMQIPNEGPVIVIVDAANPASIEARNLSAPASVNGMTVSGPFLHATSAAGLATYRIDSIVELPVHVEVQVPTGTGVAIAADSFNLAPSQIIVGAGFDTLVWDLTLNAEQQTQELTWQSNITGLVPGTTRNMTLGASIDYVTMGGSDDLSLPAQTVGSLPVTQTLQIPVRVVVPGADAIAGAAITAAQLGQTDLANRLSDLATALTNLVQNPTSAVFHSQAVASLDAAIGLLANDPYSGSLIPLLQSDRTALAAATTPAAIQTALQGLGSTLDLVNTLLVDERAHRFTLSLSPNAAVALPGAATGFALLLENQGSQTTTYSLSVAGLPPNVTAVFMQNGLPILNFTLQPGQADNGTVNGGIEGISLLLTETGGSLFPAGFTVTVAAVGSPAIARTATGVLTVRTEVIRVVDVLASPPFTNAGATVQVSARVLSAVNTPRPALAFFTVTNPSGSVIFTSPTAPLNLTVPSTLATVGVGSLNTTGLANGVYTLDVTLTDAAGVAIPGATGQGSVQIGLPIGATLTVSPTSLPPGTSTVVNTLQINRNTTLPDTLTLFGQVQTTPTATTVALYQTATQHLAYVGGTAGVDIVDVTNPASPQALGAFGGNLIVQGGGTGVRIDTINGVDYLIVGTQVSSNADRFTILMYSLANPLAPTLVNGPTGTPINHVFASDFLVQGNTIVVTTYGASGFFPGPITTQFGNVLSINVSNPAAPVLTDVLFDSPGPPNSGTTRQNSGVMVDNQIAYIASTTSTGGNLQGGVGRVLVVDYTNPANLQTLREVQIPGTVHVLAIAIEGNRAVVVGSTGGLVDFVSGLAGNMTLSVLDITDHANPQLIGTTLVTNGTFPAQPGKLTVLALGNGLFAVNETLINGNPTLLLVDPSNPSNIQVTNTPTAHLLSEMAVSGNLLYATSVDGVTIYQIYDSTTVTASVRIPNGTGVAIVAGSFNVPPTQIVPGASFDTLVWQLNATGTELTDTLTWQSTVSNLATGEVRDVTVGTRIDAQIGGAGQTQTVDLAGWSVVNLLDPGSPTSNWVLANGNTQATQTLNAVPSVLLSDFVAVGSRIEGTFRVDTNSDDDFIGFVFGYQDDQHFYLFDWKQTSQNDGVYGFAERGMSVKLVDSTSPLTGIDVWKTAGSGTNIRSLYHNTTTYADFTEYQFELEFTPGEINISIHQGATLVETFTVNDNTYQAGKFGFYNYSQAQVVYSGFTRQPLYTPLTITLPETSVTGASLLSLTPATRTVQPGATASYVVTVVNPTAAPVQYNLAVAGLPAAWVSLAATVNVPAQGSVQLPLEVATDVFAALGQLGFTVNLTSGAQTGYVPGTLELVGVPVTIDPNSHGVVSAITPSTATAGQGTPATFTLRVTNTGSATDTFNLAATLPAGFTAVFERTSVSVPPGASNFREITVQVTPPLGTAAGSYPATFTATSTTLPAVVGSSSGNVNVVNAGVDVSLNPAAAPAGTTFQLTVRNTGTTTDTFSLALAGPGALVATLAQTSVTLAAGASQTVNVNVAAINFAVQPSLQLAAIATSQNNSAVKDMASVEITIPLTFAMTSEFEEDTITLATPGPGTFLLLVENLGNGEDAYEAEIITTTGPLSATLISLDGSAVQTVPIFRLPGLSTGAIVLNANLAANGNGTITVRVRSLTNDNIISQSVATLRSTVSDFGDAPDSYGTLLATNGARHFAVGPQLGAVRDPEADGQPTSTALGDDITSLPDDEDGVVLPGLLVAGTCDCSGTGLGNSIVVNATAAGYLDAWIDFNRNGRFDGNEQIATSQRVSAGANTLRVTVPATASAGSTFARFRISSAGGLAPTGEAADGEVEDYAVQLFNPTTGSSGIIVDPNNPTGRVLYVKGTGYSDAIVVRQTSASTVTVYVAPFGTTRSFALNSFDRIVICGGAGSDAIAIEAPITKPSVIYGDEDNDSISGGLGPDIIFGGAGVDTIAGWAGDDTISGGAGVDTISGGDGIDRLVETGSGTMTLSNTAFKVGGENNPIAYFESATLIGGNAADSFNVSGWSWPLTIDGGGGMNTLVDGGNANFTLSDTSLTRAGSTTRTIALSGIQNAVLTGGGGNNTFNLSAWPFAATLNGDQGTDSFVAFGEGSFTLTDTMLVRPSLGMLRLNSLENATLNGNSSANTFNVSNWTKAATLNGAGGNDKLVASGNMNFTLSNSALTRSSAGAITLSSIEQAELVGGASNNTLNAASFSGEVKLDGGSGNDTLSSGAGIAMLLGGAGNDVLTAGSGRAVLIGGLGLDRLTGGSNDDLLIAGQTTHDNDAAALALILAEWASASSYLDRVAHLTGATGGLNGGKTLSGNNVLHDTAVDVLLGMAGEDLFFAKQVNASGSPKDNYTEKTSGELIF